MNTAEEELAERYHRLVEPGILELFDRLSVDRTRDALGKGTRLMAISPTGIIPEGLMHPRRLREVLAFLIDLPATGDTKEGLLIGWARAVGVTVNSSQRARVRESGNDRAAPTR